MRSCVFGVCLALLVPAAVLAQESADPPTVTLVVPGTNLKHYPSSRIRIGGHTQPGNTVTVNGKSVKVYPTGAFIDLVSLKKGENTVSVVAGNSLGEATSARRVNRPPSSQTTPKDLLAIEEEMMEPREDRALQPGDLLQVQFKGTPGGKAAFSLGSAHKSILMIERPSAEADGLKGVYSGVYRLQPGDRMSRRPIRFSLEVKGLGKTEKTSKGRLSVEPERWPRVGEITVPFTCLAPGLGQDRLGGAQLGYLPPGTRLELSGRIDDLWRVQLSKSSSAWIEAGSIRVLPFGTPPPRSLVGSATLHGNSHGDALTIPLETRLPFTLQPVLNPPALWLDLYGATSNLTWITQSLSAGNVLRVDWEQVEDDRLRIRLDLKHPPVWGYGAEYKNGSNQLVVTIRNAPILSPAPDAPLKGLTVALDPGHGGRNRGAIGCLGIEEKTVNLQICRKLKPLLEAAGAEVVLTRKNDEYLESVDRYLRAKDAGAHLFLSLHANSIGLASDPARSQGVSTYYRHVPFRPLSLSLYSSLLELGLEPYGNIGSFNASVLKFTDLPSCLVEMAFLSHPEDEALLIDEAFQEKIAGAMVKGITEYTKSAPSEWR